LKFLHKQFEPIRRYLSSHPRAMVTQEIEPRPLVKRYWFRRADHRDALPPRPATLSDLEAYFEASNKLAGEMPTSYFHVGSHLPTGLVPLHEAFRQIERDGDEDSFLLVGYPDGGLICYSKARLPFCEDLEEANWWTQQYTPLAAPLRGKFWALVDLPFSVAAYGLITLYRYTLSMLVGRTCRHAPTCSEFTRDAIWRFGFWPGGWMGAARLWRCRPGGTRGYDPVPETAPNKAAWYLPWRYGRWR